MKNMMEYNGFLARIEYDSDDGVFYGIVSNTVDTIHFEGGSVEELEREFKNSVEAHLEFCRKMNREPQKPFSGKFVVRIPPELHRRTALAAQKSGRSMNMFVKEAIERADETVGV